MTLLQPNHANACAIDLERGMDRAERIATAAHDLITTGNELRDLVLGYEPDVFTELARAMRNIDRACRGDKIATDAVIEAMSRVQRQLFTCAEHRVVEDIN